MSRVVKTCLILAFCMLLASCSTFEPEGVRDTEKRKTNIALKDAPSDRFFGYLPIVPLEIQGGQFNTVGDWYDNKSVLYIINDSKSSTIFKYNIYTGVSELFYETPGQIIVLEASENREYFVIHTSTSSFEANLIVLDSNGAKVVSWPANSFELQFVWNPFVESQLFITSFQADWSFNNFIMDVENQLVEEVDINQPFIQWLDHNKVAYLKWEDDFSLDAPLYMMDLNNNKEEKRLFEDKFLAFQTYEDYLITVSSTATNSSYQFFDTTTMELKESLLLPIVNTYSSSWWIPNYDYDHNTNYFYYFHPIFKEEALDSFKLVRYSTETGEVTTIIPNTEDRPIKISPDGTLSLIGYQFEKIVDMKKHEIKVLIKQT